MFLEKKILGQAGDALKLDRGRLESTSTEGKRLSNQFVFKSDLKWLQRLRVLRTQSPLLSPLVRSPDPATGGDGGGAGGKFPGLRARAAAGLGHRGGHTLLGRPLPRRHGALHRRGEQAPPLQRKGHQNKTSLASFRLFCRYLVLQQRIKCWSWCLWRGSVWFTLQQSDRAFSVWQSSWSVWSTRTCYVRGSNCKLCRGLRGIFVPTVWWSAGSFSIGTNFWLEWWVLWSYLLIHRRKFPVYTAFSCSIIRVDIVYIHFFLQKWNMSTDE